MTPDSNREREALAWQVGVWDRISPLYLCEVDKRLAPVVEHLLLRASLEPGQRVLDLGTGTGSVALAAAPRVLPGGHVLGIDISHEMLALAKQRAAAVGVEHVSFREGRTEMIPAEDRAFHAVLAGLSLMYVIDRRAAAREIARVLRPGGRLIAAVWSEAETCDIVLFQHTAGSFAPPPPVSGVGPGALADARPFLAQLTEAGIEASVETETLGFDFEDFASAWEVLAGVTTAGLTPQQQAQAKAAVRAVMWPHDGPRHFRNVTQFIVGRRVR